ncbi:MAG: ETEC_3214 domain-containing protein [Actinomycetota bacterium]
MKTLLAIVAFCAAATAVLGFLGYLPKIFDAVKGLYFRTPLGIKRRFYKRLRRLSPDVQLDYFSDTLGLTPFFRNTRGEFSEHVYVHKLFYLQALVDEQGTVVSYGVTTRSSDFTPAIWPHNLHPETVPMIPNLQLGRFSFSEVHLDPEEINGWVGARRFGYSESFYTGNPGLYRHYILGINDAGSTNLDWIRDLDRLIPPKSGPLLKVDRKTDWDDVTRFLERDDVDAFRKAARPNTYGVTKAHFSWSGTDGSSIPPTGPDADQVRTLNE